MRLIRLEIQGYKSFANRTEIIFEDGITAIVGPNGSGKSNVADALRWALGETNVRHLRGKKSEDLIFAGSDGRAQVGMAQVSLTLDNGDGWFNPLSYETKKAAAQTKNGHATALTNGSPPKLSEALLASAPAEVTITRRLYRDGSGEYFINGQRARLGDVTHLLAAGGISGDTYVVIGQGLVDQALALRPEDRRAMLDEAAGIKPLQAQRDRALARLDETRANLVRVSDIVAELGPQVRRLERQAARTQEHQRISGELEGVLVTWYGHQWYLAQDEVRAAETKLAQRREAGAKSEQAVKEALSRSETLRLERDRQQGVVETLRRQAGRLRDTAENTRRELAVAEERSKQLTTRHAEVLAEVEHLSRNTLEAANHVEQAKATASQAVGEAETTAAALRAVQAEFNTARAEVQRHQAALETARQAAQKAASVALNTRTRAESQTDRLTELERAVAEAEEVYTQHKQQTQTVRARYVDAETALKTATSAVTDAEATVHAIRQEARAAQAGVETAQQGVDRARETQRQVEHRRAVLAEVRRAQLGRAVQRILDHPKLTGILGPLAQFLQIPKELEIVVAAGLGPLLHALVVETWADARRAAATLTQPDAGAVTFLVLESGEWSVERGVSIVHRPSSSASLDWLASHINTSPRFEPLVQAILRDIALTPNIDTALQWLQTLAQHNPCLRFVTHDGVVVSATGALTVGTASFATTLTHEREWASLPTPDMLASAIRDAQERVNQARQVVEAVRLRVTEAEGEAQRCRQTRDTARGAYTAAETALERAATAEAFHHRAWTRQTEDLTRLKRQVDTLQSEATQAAAEQALADARVAELMGQPLPDLSDLQTRLAQGQTAAAMAAQNRQMYTRQWEQRQAELAQLERSVQERRQRADSLAQEAAAVTKRLTHLRAEAERLATERATLRQALDPAETTLANLGQEARALEDELTNLREAAHHADRALHQAQAELRESQDRVRRLMKDVEADLDLLPKLPDGVPNQLRLAFDGQTELTPVSVLSADVEDKVRTLRGQLRRLGSPDPDSLTEYQTLVERHTFMTNQIADLEKAATDLHAIIVELDQAMTARFEAVFDQVAQRFSRNFRELFGGGSAQMTLTEGGGLDINARPPGKRLQPLSLLSGGERALTASALIFALLEVSKTPFCMLDEVDAALDEANVGRFRAALTRLASRTQVILVTHNRGTIEAAHAVYGITMGGQGISQAISLRLRERVHVDSGLAAD